MKKFILLAFACLSCSSSSNNASTTTTTTNGGGTDAGDVDAGGMYNTLSGTVTASGASATFSGAMEESNITQGDETAYYAAPEFASVGLPNVVFSGAAGSKLVGLSIVMPKTKGPPAATTLTCDDPLTPANISFGWTDSNGAHSVGASPGVTGSSCTISFQAPTYVTSNSEGEWYFAHGALNGTLVSAPEDGGVETGSISASW